MIGRPIKPFDIMRKVVDVVIRHLTIDYASFNNDM